MSVLTLDWRAGEPAGWRCRQGCIATRKALAPLRGFRPRSGGLRGCGAVGTSSSRLHFRSRRCGWWRMHWLYFARFWSAPGSFRLVVFSGSSTGALLQKIGNARWRMAGRVS